MSNRTGEGRAVFDRMARVLGVLALLASALLWSAPAGAVSVVVSPASLPLSPSGPYSAARDKPVGTVIATSSAIISATDISGTCVVTALILSGAAANGDIFTTGVAGLGVKLYYYNGLTRVQLAPNIQVSVAATLSGPGTVSTVEAELVVTGQVSSGTLNALPSVNLTFLAAGAGCGVVTLADKTLTVTAGNGTVTASSCVVTSPAIAVGLPTVSTQQLDAAGKTAGLTQFTIPLNCSSVTADVYVTLTDATDASNTTSLLTLQPAATAGNVKLQILRNNGTAVSYGPDAATAGNTNQFFVGPASTVSNIPLGVQYYSTGVATAGSVHAAATFTMSYQ